MDQVKIGRFIAELRKGKEMTQKELADAIGVSDKAISKWECGNGMPELSMLMPLCELLEINVNELLSGERLSHNNYSQKAEENIMSLMKEKEENKKQGKKNIFWAAFTLILTILAVYVVISYTLIMSLGLHHQGYGYLNDYPTASLMLVAAVVTLTAVRLWRPFFRVFGIIFGSREYSVCQVEESAIALRLVGNAMMVTGILITSIDLIIVLWDMSSMFRNISEAEQMGIPVSFAISLIGLVYGFAVKLLFLPLQSRLEVAAARLKYQHSFGDAGEPK